MNRYLASLLILCEMYASSVLRYAMGAVILWFSIQQFLHNGTWTAYIPDSIVALTHIDAPILVFFNACFEFIFSLLLIFGWQTRIVSLLLALHLLDITWVVGYGEIGARDFGLSMATLAIAMRGSDILCIQQKEPLEIIQSSNQSSHEPINLA